METSKLDQLRIEREPEVESRPVPWPLIAAVSWWFLKPPAAINVRTAVAREIATLRALGFRAGPVAQALRGL